MHSLLFEAKSIQEYLFQSGRLRDVIGGSELVDSLTGELLEKVLDALGLKEGRDLDLSRRAGGAFYAFSESADKLRNLEALWSLAVQQYAPGLAYVIGEGQGEDALRAFDGARDAIRSDTNRHRPRLPVASPITERSRRTGLAAEGQDTDAAPVDASILRKRQLADLSRAGLIDRFSPPEAELGWRDWPRNLEPGEEGAFPFLGDDRTVALLHADGNGLGQLLMTARRAAEKAPEGFIKRFRELSEVIAKCTQESAQEATRQVLAPARQDDEPLAARPILLGGDDLTLLIRADLALSYLRVFTESFEARSQEALADLAGLGLWDLPERLTLGASIVYLRSSQPFYLASGLAESLIDSAKVAAKALDPAAPPSAVTFHRVTSSLVEDYGQILEREHTHYDAETAYRDTLGPYFLGAGERRPRLDDLLALQGLLQGEGMARGPTRQLLTLLGLSPDQARTRYRRWRQLMRDHRSAELTQFDALMARLVDEYSEDVDLPFGAGLDGQTVRVSPAGDALALMAVGNRADGEGPTSEEEVAA